MERLAVFAPPSGEKKGTHRSCDGGDEGHTVPRSANARLPLTYPTATRRAPFLSPLAQGEDMKQGFH